MDSEAIGDKYSQLCRTVLLVLAERDPLGLADAENSLLDEYEPEAREIARRSLGATADADGLRTLIQGVFVQQFDTQVSDEDLEAIVAAAS